MSPYFCLLMVLLNKCVPSCTTAMAIYHSIPKLQGAIPVQSETTTDGDLVGQTSIEPDMSNCTFRLLELEDVVIHQYKLLVKEYNVSIPNAGSPLYFEATLNTCFGRSEALNREILYVCKKWGYEIEEYRWLENGQMELNGKVQEPGTFAIKDNILYACSGVVDNDDNAQPAFREKVQIVMGHVLSVVSIVALIAHLIAFCLVPSLRNLPGLNLAAISVAYLMEYLFSLIGQIPSVLGLECVLIGNMQQYFYLVTFFCMNTMAFDVWRNMKRATTQLTVSSLNAKRRQLLFYFIYSWGTPFVIVFATMWLDISKSTPLWIRPQFGKGNKCWFGNYWANLFLFIVPVFSLIFLNVVFFVMSSCIIKYNTMKYTSEEHKQTIRHNFGLYLRLASMMGMTWILTVIAAIAKTYWLWFLADVMSSLQGLVVFLLFTCSRNVFTTIREKLSLKNLSVITPKTSTRNVTISKELVTGNARMPKTSSTGIPNISTLPSGHATISKVSTMDIPNLKATGDARIPNNCFTNILNDKEILSEDERTRKTCTTVVPNHEENEAKDRIRT